MSTNDTDFGKRFLDAHGMPYERDAGIDGVPKKTSHLEKPGAGMFPREFNELRQALYEHHHDIWEVCGGMMIHNHDMLITSLDGILDTQATGDMAKDCARWLKALELRPRTYRN